MKKAENHKKFYEMFLDQLRDVYSAETQIIEALPKVINAVTTKELKDALKNHLNETKRQKERLDMLFGELGESPEDKFCEAMEGILKEGEEIIARKDPNFIEDAALIGACQKVEHYEIATYGTLRTFAHHLELDRAEDILQEILDEEGKANKLLSKLAEGSWLTSGINAQAAR